MRYQLTRASFLTLSMLLLSLQCGLLYYHRYSQFVIRTTVLLRGITENGNYSLNTSTPLGMRYGSNATTQRPLLYTVTQVYNITDEPYAHQRKMLELVEQECERQVMESGLWKRVGQTSQTLCPCVPAGLRGVLPVLTKPLPWKLLESMHQELGPGGFWAPPNCTSIYRVAVLIPYLDRDSHLRVFLRHMVPLLQKQFITFAIYVIEQTINDRFNRAFLLNVGFTEAQKDDLNWDCNISHDVDQMPENDLNLYHCPRHIRHMSASISAHNYRLIYKSFFGAVSAIRTEVFQQVNGYPNRYFGWGGEDDDMFQRLHSAGYQLNRYPMQVARYKSLTHKHANIARERFTRLKQQSALAAKDGLNSLKYRLLLREKKHYFTHIKVDIREEDINKNLGSVPNKV